MKNVFRMSLSSYNAEQFIKFLIVGCSNFAISFTVFYLCYKKWNLFNHLITGMGDLGSIIIDSLSDAGIELPDGAFANVIGYSAGIVNSFLWNRIWTFKVLTKAKKQFKRFIALNIVCLLTSSFVIFIFVDILSWPYKLVWFTTMAFITMLNFIGSKLWVFKKVDEMRKPAYSRGGFQ